MRKVVVVLVLAVFLLSTGSWAKTGKVSLGALYGVKTAGSQSSTLAGVQAKYGVTENVDLAGRWQFGNISDVWPLVTLKYLTGLGIYNFTVLSDRFVPYVGAGFSFLSISGATWSAVGSSLSYNSLVAVAGVNFYVTDELAFSAEVLRETIETTSVLGVTAGASYTF